jgi:hypothetical protein
MGGVPWSSIVLCHAFHLCYNGPVPRQGTLRMARVVLRDMGHAGGLTVCGGVYTASSVSSGGGPYAFKMGAGTRHARTPSSLKL